MKFLEWNNLISQHFFNIQNGGKETHLYLTKKDIILLSRPYFIDETDSEIWADYLNKLKSGLPGSKSCLNIIEKANHAYSEWKKPGLRSIDGVKLTFPPYVSYLVFFVLPLVDIQDKYNSNNYYDRLNDFLIENGINQNLQNQLSKIENLWSDLRSWANIVNNGELGYFRLRNFIHPNWIYVGKVFSQCVFPPKAIKKLPEMFLHAGMIPESYYSDAEIKRYLLQHGSSILHLSNNIIDTIRKSETNELGQSIIETAKNEYRKWTGESHSTDENDTTIRTIRNDISSRIYLQFQLFTNTGRIEFSYRIKSANEFPEDLNFSGNDIREEKGGYSKSLILPFKETFQFRDDFNKWVAMFPSKEIRLFISASILQFSSDYWIETDTLSRLSWMYLLCKNSSRQRIYDWLRTQCTDFIDETDYANMPQGYSLFKFLNPKEGLVDIPELTLQREKSIHLVSSLQFDFRTFTDDFLPAVEIENSDGTESVYLQYKNSENKLLLEKKSTEPEQWLLPMDVSLYSDFNIRVQEETLKGNETTYRIITSNDSAIHLDDSQLPKRDSFGRIADNDITIYSIGSNPVGVKLARQIPYQHLFRGTREDSTSEITKPRYTHTEGNILLSFLTLKGKSTAQEFYIAFEFLYSKYFGDKIQSNNFNYTKIKKASLNFLDFLGYLDYEYDTKSIVVNPPQLILLPTSKGRKVLLIGGRDSSLVNSIINTAPKYNLQVVITRQFHSNEDLLLPDAITIKSYGAAKECFGEKNLTAFAKELNINFNPTELVQVGLQQFCSNIEDYEKELYSKNETLLTFEDWATYIFNTDNLQLEQTYYDNFDKSFSLLEYRLRPWEYHHRLWTNQKCYSIDLNWGKYIALKHFRKNIILYNPKNEKVAIPTSLPLPRLLAESIMLLSGLAPVYSRIDSKGYRIYENIPSMFIHNLFDKLKQTTIDCNF